MLPCGRKEPPPSTHAFNRVRDIATNPIENLNGSVARFSRNVKRWGDGQMVLRWVASALSDAAGRMRKLRGSSQMRSLLKALDARRTDTDNGTFRKAA